MLTRPRDLSDDALASALRDGWSIVVASMDYRPVGFGSHHWEAVDVDGARWFVTVDEARRSAHLRRALTTAMALRGAGMEFVAAPVGTGAGEPLRPIGSYVVACYPFIEGDSGDSFAWDDVAPDYPTAMLDMLVSLHGTRDELRPCAAADDFVIPAAGTLADLDVPDAGPYSRPTAKLLAQHARAIRDALDRYDALVARKGDQPRRVLTHGEPHPGNTMRTASGWLLLDWETVRVAPPERDLWDLAGLWDAYEGATNTRLQPSLLDLYRLRWDLTDMAVYVTRFRAPHEETADDLKSWDVFCELVDRL